MDSNVVPAFVVRHTPPELEATKYLFGFFGSTANSDILPEVSAGPILLNFRPEISTVSKPVFFSFVLVASTLAFFPLVSWALIPEVNRTAKDNSISFSDIFFLIDSISILNLFVGSKDKKCQRNPIIIRLNVFDNLAAYFIKNPAEWSKHPGYQNKHETALRGISSFKSIQPHRSGLYIT